MRPTSLRRPVIRRTSIAALLALAAWPCGRTHATNYTWLGNNSVNWVDSANWQGGTIPPSDLLNTDLLFANSGGPYSVINGSYSIHSLSFATNANAFTFLNGPLTLGAGGLTQNAASAETFSAPVLLGANQTWSLASGTGALSFSGGVNTGTGSAAYALTINAASTTGSGNVLGGAITGGGSLTKTGAGTLTLTGASNFSATAGGQLVNINAGTLAVDTGGSLTSSGFLTVNTGAALAVKGTGSIRFDGGRIDVSSEAAQLPAGFTLSDSGVVNAGTLTFDNAVATQSGGTLTVGGRMTVGNNATSQYTLTGGTLTSSITQVGGSTGATGTFVQTGGLHSVGTLLVGYATGAGTYTLNGGVLAASTVSNGQNSTGRAGAGVLDFNGGTLQATASSATFLTQATGTNGTPGSLSAIVQAGGARIDTNGFNDSVLLPLAHDNALGATMDGGLTKVGAGTLTLTGASTYTGDTLVSAGTLAVTSGSLSGGRNFTVDAAAGTTANATIGTTGSVANREIFVGVSGTGMLTQNGGSVSTASDNTLDLAVHAGSTGTYTLNAGTLSTGYIGVGEVGTGSFVQTGGSVRNGYEVYVGSNSGGTGTWTQSGGSTTINANLYLGNATGSSGTYNLSGAGSSLSTSNVIIGSSGTGTFNQTGGSFTTNGNQLFIGYVTGSNGTYNLSGAGSSLSTASANVGYVGTGTFTQTGGSFTTNGDRLVLGSSPGSSGTYNLSGGTLTTGATQVSDDASTGAFTQTGGTHTTGTLRLTGYSTSSVGTYTLGGGTLNTGQVGAGEVYYYSITGTSTFHFNGGTLQASGNSTSFFQGLTTADVQAGGAKIDSNGYNVTVAQNLVHSTAGGAPALDGGLTKLGAGTLTLSGTSTYTGKTTINAGTLVITGSVVSGGGGSLIVSGTPVPTLNLSGNLSTGEATVGYFDSGTFNQSAGSFTTNGNLLVVGSSPSSIGTYTLSGGSLSTGTAAMGNVGTGTFTQTGGSFTTNGNILYLGVNAGSSGTYNLSGGTLTTGATQVSDDVSTGVFTQTGGTHTTGTLRLTGYSTSSVGTYTLGGGTLNAGQVVAGDDYYSTTGTSTFHFNGGTLQASGSSTSFFQGLTTADVQAGGAKIDSNGYNVTVAQNLVHSTAGGAPALDGGLTKLGAGTLTLTGTNTFTGPVNINGGTLAISSEAALGATGAGSGPVTVGGGGTLRFTGSTTLTRPYNLGVATLGVAGGNTLTFGSGATVNGGFLAGPGTDVLGDGTTLNAVTTLPGSTLTQSGGTTASLNNTTVRGTFNQTGGTANLNNALVLGSGQLNVGGTVNATGTEIQGVTTINAGGTLASSGASLFLTGGSRTTINSGGTLSAASGTSIELNGSQLVNNGTQQGALNVNYGSTAKGNGTFGDVNVGDGGQFGTNSVGGGSNLNTMPGFSVIHLTGGGGLVATNPALIVGPQPSATPGANNVGSLTLHGGGLLNIRVEDAAGAAGTGYDTTRASGALTLSSDASPANQITIRLSSLNANGNPGAALNFDPGQNYQFVLVQAAGGLVGYQPGEFAVDASGFTNALDGGSFSVYEQGNNQLVLAFTAVPEPGTWTAVLCVAAGWMFHTLRTRRRENPALRRSSACLLVSGLLLWTNAAMPAVHAADLLHPPTDAAHPVLDSTTDNLLHALDGGRLDDLGGGSAEPRARARPFDPATKSVNDERQASDEAVATSSSVPTHDPAPWFSSGNPAWLHAPAAGPAGRIAAERDPASPASVPGPRAAQTLFSWQGGAASNNWTLGGNWSLGNAPSNDGTATVAFSSTNLKNGVAYVYPNLNADYNVNQLYFSGSQTFSLLSDGGHSLTIQGGGVSQNSSAAQNVNVPTYLQANQTWNSGGAGAVNFNNTLTVSNAMTWTYSAGTTYTNILQVALPSTTGFIGSNASNTSTVTQTGGSLTADTLRLGNDTPSGVFDSAGSTGVYNLNGGTLTVGTITGLYPANFFTASQGLLNVGGGTLRAEADSADWISGITSFHSTGDVTIDTNGHNVTSRTGISPGTYTVPAGPNATATSEYDGNLTKTGDGTLTMLAALRVNGNLTVNAGTLALSSGNSSFLDIVVDGANPSGTMLNLNSGSSLTGWNLYVGRTQTGGTFNLNAGGVVLFNSPYVQGTLSIGTSAGSSGTFNQSGGTLSAPFANVGDAGTGTFNLTGGVATFVQALHIGSSSGGSGTFNLDSGGLLQTHQILGGAGTGVFNFNGGTWRANAANTTGALSGLTRASVQAGGASIDTNGYDLTVGQALVHDPAGNAPAADGGLTKLGTGSLTLSGTNTYTGGTNVAAGTLVASNNGNAVPAGTVRISSGAVLALGNTNTSTPIYQAGAVTFQGAGTLQKTGAGNLQFGNNGGNVTVSMDAGALIDVQAGTLAGSYGFNGVWTNNQAGLNVAGAATFDGVEANVRVDALTGAGTVQGGYQNVGSLTVGVANGSGTFSGTLQDNGNSGGRLTLIKAGAGTQILAGSGTYTGGTSVNGGTLQIDNNPGAASPTAGRLGGTSAITINNGATLLLSGGASVADRLNDTATLTINAGGKFATGGLSEGSAAAGSTAGVGALTLAGGATLDFGTGANGSTLLAASGSISSSGTISILNWTGTARADSGAVGNDRLLFAADPGFSATRLAQFSFYDDNGALIGSGAQELSYHGFTELVPVPETATWIGGALLLLTATGAAVRRRRRMVLE